MSVDLPAPHGPTIPIRNRLLPGSSIIVHQIAKLLQITVYGQHFSVVDYHAVRWASLFHVNNLLLHFIIQFFDDSKSQMLSPTQLDFLISRNRQANRHAAHIVAAARGNFQDENTDVVGWPLIVQFDRIGK